jgi:hypothetical protein
MPRTVRFIEAGDPAEERKLARRMVMPCCGVLPLHASPVFAIYGCERWPAPPYPAAAHLADLDGTDLADASILSRGRETTALGHYGAGGL